jgi:glyoxylase-like metal-dependent hydrolase (beta-lactamase superfamily II)
MNVTMHRQRLFAIASICIVALAAWLSGLRGDRPATWVEVSPGVWRTASMPYGYALVAGDAAMLIDAPLSADDLLRLTGARRVERVLLTHHHLDTSANVGALLAARVPVQAPKASADWLTPAAVAKFWREVIPLRNSRTAYFVVPEGIDGIDCSLTDGQSIAWHDWTLKVIATPGHSFDHVSFTVTKKSETAPILFAGDAIAAPGKIWTPYTTDWDHWTDAGLRPTATSLRKLAALKPRVVLPAHGEPIKKDAVNALEQAAAAVEEVAFLKSFERFSKQRLGDPPAYPFLVPREQVGSAGDKPWSRVSEHLFITGNTYVLTSTQTDGFMVMDPWGKRSIDQIVKLQSERRLGKPELVMFSHAHYDHFDGVYDLPGRDGYQVWSLDLVAGPLADPFRVRAPFLDARPIRFERRFKDGETATWREYNFRFHHLPGQSRFTMGVETTIDGKRCYFTADNFFHQDQYSGSGGWMGLNRSWPLPYAASAKKVLEAAPDWILAEHGGPYVFNAEDYRRRVKWGEASARAADVICVSGNHERDWDPYRVQAEPVLQSVKAGDVVKVLLVITATRPQAEPVTVTLAGRGLVPDQQWDLSPAPNRPVRLEVSLPMSAKAKAGRHVFPLRVRDTTGSDATDAFVAVDVTP